MSGIVPRIIELKGVDPETAFLEAQREARHLHGNSGNTGTLADTDSHIIVNGPALLPWDCRRVAQQMLRDGHAKAGGPVFLLRLADPAKIKTVKTTIDITGMAAGQADDAIDKAVRDKLPDERWGIASIELRGQEADGPERKGTTKTKTIVTPGTGKKITKYSVRNAEDGREIGSFDSLAEARSWMKTTLAGGAAPMFCIAVTTKESGPLITGQNQILKRTIAAVATIGQPAAGGNGSYLAAGIFNTP